MDSFRKRHKIDISELKDFNVREAFDFFATDDFSKLSYVSNTDDELLIDITLRTRPPQVPTFNNVFSKIQGYTKDIVGQIDNVKLVGNIISFDLIYFNTLLGRKYYKEKHGFNVFFRKHKMELNTSGKMTKGATLTTTDNTITIIDFSINEKENILQLIN